ncbi:hypothetical protein GCM10011324_07070 [Allosediminivita pacifica]|nr:hypothetical protein GCM10011324_07070 [Allosediminivita pacifica]
MDDPRRAERDGEGLRLFRKVAVHGKRIRRAARDTPEGHNRTHPWKAIVRRAGNPSQGPVPCPACHRNQPPVRDDGPGRANHPAKFAPCPK